MRRAQAHVQATDACKQVKYTQICGLEERGRQRSREEKEFQGHGPLNDDLLLAQVHSTSRCDPAPPQNVTQVSHYSHSTWGALCVVGECKVLSSIGVEVSVCLCVHRKINQFQSAFPPVF